MPMGFFKEGYLTMSSSLLGKLDERGGKDIAVMYVLHDDWRD
jgi:hypothetical protein